MKSLKICKASAGSGKTYMLTSEFLKLAFKSDDYFRRVLAVTFTNKAADEMKTRILKEVNTIINNPEKSGHFSDLKKIYSDSTEAELLDRALHIRDHILHNYSNFAVSTIDSFVQKILRSFTYEIGIQGGYKIELDSNKVLEDLTDLLYRDIASNANLQKWLVKFASNRIEDGKNWDFRQEIRSLAGEIFKETYQNVGSQADLPDSKSINEYYDQLLKIRQGFKNKLKDYSKQAGQIISKNGLVGNESKNFTTITNFLTRYIVEGKYSPAKTVLEAIGEVDKWYAKSSPETVKAAIRGAYPSLNALIIEILAFVQDNLTDFTTASAILDNFYSFGVFNDILAILPQYREDNNLMLISDSTKLLRGLVGENDTPFIYEKTGNRFKNILIDEFQDTSGFQWDIFRPLIENTIAEANFNLIVGDVKQSIYRWRGGDWKLLLEKVSTDIGSSLIENESLQTNWRSRKNVIDFNNSLFEFAPHCLQDEYNKSLDEIIDSSARDVLVDEGFDRILVRAYDDSSQKIANKSINEQNWGKVAVQFYPNGNKTERREPILEDLPVKVEELLTLRKYKPSDIAILVRTNKEAKDVFDSLMYYQQNIPNAFRYPIISGDSLYVGKSMAVQLIVAAMKYLISSEDQINRAELVYKYSILKFDDEGFDQHLLFRNAKTNGLGDDLPQAFVSNLADFRKLSLFELVEKLIEVFELECITDSLPFIRTFEDVVVAYMTTESSDLSKFLEWFELTGSKKSIPVPEDQDALKIMTVHRSKGLAFRVVIIPFCDWEFGQSTQVMWCETGDSNFSALPYVPVTYRAQLADTIFRKKYFEEKAYLFMDTLNTLYVATTRAEDELIIFTHAPKKDDGKIANICDLLFALCNQPEGQISTFFKPDENKLEMEDNFNKIETQQHQPIGKTYQMKDYPLNEWRGKLSIKHQSQDFFEAGDAKRTEKINHGILMHEIMSKIETPKDIEGALREIYFEGEINREEMALLKQKIEKSCELDSVKDWFSGNYLVMNEKTITLGSGATRIPDRVLIGKNKAIVIDFKFGQMHAEYKDQVRDYMKLIHEIEALPVEGFLYFPETGVSVRVEN